MNDRGFDIDNPGFYEYDKPELWNRTKKRLTEISECGMVEVGFGYFGYKGVVSGLYIEKVCSYSDEDFKDYMDWAKGLISEHLLKQETK